MKRDYKLYLNDIKESTHYIELYLYGVSKETFMQNTQIQDALVRRLEIIGEASKNVPKSLKIKNKKIPWTEMAQFRDLVTHSYYEVSLERIWKTAKERIPQIQKLFDSITLV